MKNSTWKDLLGEQPKYGWKESMKIMRSNLKKKEVHADAIDLLEKMMVVDHAKRITPKEALQHPFFDEVRIYQQ